MSLEVDWEQVTLAKEGDETTLDKVGLRLIHKGPEFPPHHPPSQNIDSIWNVSKLASTFKGASCPLTRPLTR